jgi:hypothetical protein
MSQIKITGRPKGYLPKTGFKYQIFKRNLNVSPVWSPCDYAIDREHKDELITTHSQAHGEGWEFGFIVVPRRFWSEDEQNKEPRQDMRPMNVRY